VEVAKSSVEPPQRLSLRPAGAADLPLIYRAERDYVRAVEPAGEAGWTEATDRNLQLWVDNLATTTVLAMDGEAAGYVMWRAESSGAALVITLQVLPAFRRRGLGRRLLDVVAEQARAQGLGPVTLGVHRENPAVALYEAAGFLPTGTDGEYLLYARS
jgi:ribosomal protein S18 acetylase RimI-like enzyme